MALTLSDLRKRTINHTFPPHTSLEEVINRMQFIQADPIRSPARAQDLILRHRVKDYHVGDLERQYPKLPLEEDFLYAYGFMHTDKAALHYPRKISKLSALERQVLAYVKLNGPKHPGEVASQFGHTRVINDWGGYSKSTKIALDRLHRGGFLRVASRAKGVRVYEAIPENPQTLTTDERLRELVYLTAKILSPISERALQQSLFILRRHFGETKSAIRSLVKSGRLQEDTVDGITYLYVPTNATDQDLDDSVRFLSPFDPLIWDRSRFEHFFGWQYRFEAYTPPAKRIRGYYAMPILWNDEVIGWVNVSYADGKIDVNDGYVNSKPNDSLFQKEFDQEVSRMEYFLSNND